MAFSSPSVLLDSKTGRELREITRLFKYQNQPNTCVPTSIYNILNEIANRTGNKDVALSEKRINEITRTKDYAAEQLRVVVENLNQSLKKFGYRAHQDRNTTTNQLTSILKDETCSFPMIAVSYKYLEVEQRIIFPSSDPLLNPDHVIIVLRMDSDTDTMAFFDPYVGISPAMRRESQGYGRGVVVKPVVRMLDDYWDNAWDKSWMFWVKWDKSTTTRITTYLEGGKAEEKI